MPLTIEDCECGRTPHVWCNSVSKMFRILCECGRNVYLATFQEAMELWNARIRSLKDADIRIHMHE